MLRPFKETVMLGLAPGIYSHWQLVNPRIKSEDDREDEAIVRFFRQQPDGE